MSRVNKQEIDIIMGIYNCEKYLEESILSIVNQTYKCWKLILCDDGSTDSTYKIAKKFHDKYKNQIVLLKNEKNMGLNFTLNKCLKYVTGEFIARQDADDTSSINRLEKEIIFLNSHPDYAFVSCNSSLFDENGEWGLLKLVENPQKDDFLKKSPFCHASVLIRKKAMMDVGGYSVDDKLLRVEDYHLWFKLYSQGYKGYNIQEVLYHIRDDRDAVSRRNWKNRKNEYYVRKVGYKMLEISWYKRIYQFRPLVIGILPTWFYTFLHRMILKK